MSCSSGECAKPLIPISERPVTKCSTEIYKQFKDAVVHIDAIPKFSFNAPYVTGGLGIPGAYTLGLTGSPSMTGAVPAIPVLPLSYSGFLKGCQGYIVSTSSFLFAFVLALFYNQLIYSGLGLTGTTFDNPSLALTNSVLITIEQVITIIFDPNNPRSVSDFFDIFVTVFNVNGCGRAYVYRAYVVGVDFDTGVAVYRIDWCDPWNKCCLQLTKHKYLEFGSSTCYTPGSPVHIIGSQSQASPLCMMSGSMVNNNDVLTNGTITYQAVLTDVVVQNGAEGAPMLDQCGYVVGIVTGRTGVVLTTDQSSNINARLLGSVPAALTTNSGQAFGVAADFIANVVDRIIDNDKNPGCSEFVIYNSIYGFNLYRHATLGVVGCYRTGAEIGLYGADVVYPADIERWYDPAYCNINRELIGLIVKSVCGPLAEAYEDCRNQQFPVFSGKTIITPDIDFIGYQVEPFDVITGLNGLAIGQLPTQITPDTLLYNLRACDTVVVEFMKACESYTQCHKLCTSLGDSLAFLFNVPNVYNTSTGLVTLTGTLLNQILAWFVCSLSQVQRTYLMSLALSGSVTPIGVYGTALLTQILNGTGKIFVDPFGLLSIANLPVIIPAVDINLNYNGGVISNTCFSNYIMNYLP